ncbi:hypothetical protein DVH24_003781 [Malus domestica]|uniref:Uncharacterized protein n=1 Tax=Malus domestica TaxID=3750 RepID=A0A498K4E5_MALDO|nr:hypothetical protein DVH24_003781 [Malus domestica]
MENQSLNSIFKSGVFTKIIEIVNILNSTPPPNLRWRHHYEHLGPTLVKIYPSVEVAPKLDLKQLPTHLRYAFLGASESLPMIIASKLTSLEEEKFLRVFREYKTTLGWIIADIKGIRPTLCMHRILF